jgi:hypothetical protein
MERKSKVERIKLWVDYFKHLTTLSTGSIVLIATLLEKAMPHARARAAIITSLIGFLACVLGAVLSLTCMAVEMGAWEDDEDPEPWTETPLLVGIILSWSGFLTGLFALAVFAIRNLNVLSN